MESKGFATLPLAAVILLLCMVTNGSGQQTPVVKIFQLDEVCLGCMCEAVSDCNRSLRCQEGVCGLFRITKPYWMDANRPTVPQDQPTDELAFERCTTDPVCAGQTVRNYMFNFAQDCNGDSVIDCHDYAAIHMLGGFNCTGSLKPGYENKLNFCLTMVKILSGGDVGENLVR